MKVGIIGPEHMAATWEKYLRYISDIEEVIIAPRLDLINDIDTCLVLNEATSPGSGTRPLMDALKRGYHILWVAPLPTDPSEINKCFELAEESGVIVMFSMWSHYSPATQWLFNHIATPDKIHIHREWPGPQHTPDRFTLYRIFLEELSICTAWTRSRTVRFEGDSGLPSSRIGESRDMHQLLLDFSNGSRASIVLIPYGLENRHSRFVRDSRLAAVCQINDHIIRKWFLQGETSHVPEIMRFDFREPARRLLSHFFRSVKSREQPIFGIRELNQLAGLMQQFPIP
jgi:predicted dehydrogenase